MIAERIANSRATVETDPYNSFSPHGDDNKFGAIRRSDDNNHGEDSMAHMFGDDKGVLKNFKGGEDPTENKQLPLSSNAVTNDTDAHGSKNTIKKLTANHEFEEIKEVDEYNDSFDAKRHAEHLNSEPTKQDRDFEKNTFDFVQGKNPNKHHKLEEEDIEANHTNDNNDDDEPDMLMVEHKFCTQCNIEQPLRTKHCRSCKKCVSTYDHHCPWVGNCIGEK